MKKKISKKKEEELAHKEFEKSLKSIVNNSKILDKIYYLPKEYTKAIIKSEEIVSLLFTGKAGVGKSYGILQSLNELKADYVYVSGFTSPLALYIFLYQNRKKGKIVVFDDTYGLINNQASVSILLNALYTSSGKRELIWYSTTPILKIPKKFLFEAKLILLTNELPKKLSSDLIKSRCITYNFSYSNKEILEIMKAISKVKHPKLSMEQRVEIFNFIKENSNETTENFDLRIQKKIEDLYLYDKTKWKILSYPLLTNNEKLVLLKTFLEENKKPKEAMKKWIKKTGLSKRQYFRYKAMINKGNKGM